MGVKWMCLLFTLTVITGQIHGTVDARAQGSRLSANVQAKRDQYETRSLSNEEEHDSHSDINKIWNLIMTLEVATARLEKIQSELDGKITSIEQELMSNHGLDSASLLLSQPVPDEAVVNTDIMQVTFMDQIVMPTVPDQDDGVGQGTQTVPLALEDQVSVISGEQQQQQQDDKHKESELLQQDHLQQTQPQSQQDQQSQPPPLQQSPTQSEPSQADQKQSQTTQLRQEQPTQEPPLQQIQQGAAGSELSEIDKIIALASGLSRRQKARPSGQVRSSARNPPIWQDDRRAKVPPFLEAIAREGRMVEREGLPWLSIK
ncbi:adenylate cyclase, terminal-differentiation specific-like [Patiria miniata]|uniref:Uncharacterized protein n=1 Tax=Patiria miniata TaxID=46514 RepID=A0A914A381_PATMI|nr:adenylate cyclase, terminal-differentiation specific-like [Patiria miniata]